MFLISFCLIASAEFAFDNQQRLVDFFYESFMTESVIQLQEEKTNKSSDSFNSDLFSGEGIRFTKISIGDESYTVMISSEDENPILAIGYAGEKQLELLSISDILQEKFGVNYKFLDFYSLENLESINESEQEFLLAVKEDFGMMWDKGEHYILFTASRIQPTSEGLPVFSFAVKFVKKGANERFDRYIKRLSSNNRPNSIKNISSNFYKKFPESINTE